MIDAHAVLAHLEELRSLTADEKGAQRVAWTPAWAKARAWFEGKLNELPVEHHYDAAGNHWVTLPGKSRRALVLGSHLDSVPDGGWLDGCLGVLAGLEVLKAIAKRSDGQPPCTIKLVDWADEEGARFGRSLFGSAAFAGRHTIEADRGRTDREGITMEAALGSCGVEMDRVGEAANEQKDIGAYLELHIEQGPVLEHAGKALGVVTGTKGVERWAITFTGQEAHAGSTPMNVRRDALAACAKLALETRRIAGQHTDAVATMGSVKTFPGIATAVVGRCEATLDLRDLDTATLATMLAQTKAASQRFAEEEGCTVAWSKIWSIEPVAFHPQLMTFIEEAVLEMTGATQRLPSGPLHDAAEVARLGVPAGMLFVQSLRGLSHHREEDSQRLHLMQAAEAFGRAAESTMHWLAGDGGMDLWAEEHRTPHPAALPGA